MKGLLSDPICCCFPADVFSFFEAEEEQTSIQLAQPRCGRYPDPGPCNGAIAKWFFNPSALQCQLFAYGRFIGIPTLLLLTHVACHHEPEKEIAN